MIQFLKNTRKRLLAKRRVRVYVLYAIGEIFLIVVGILFALQIGNWNATQKEAKLEFQLLKGLSKDLTINIEKLEILLEDDSFLISGNEYLLQVLRNPQSTYSNDLDELFGNMNRYSVFYPQRMTYEFLKTGGFSLIKNDMLRSEIINLYDYTYTNNAEVDMELRKGLYENSNAVFLKHLDTGEEVFLKRPRDFDAVKNDYEFINHLAHITGEQKTLSIFANENLINTVEVKESIDREIVKLTKK